MDRIIAGGIMLYVVWVLYIMFPKQWRNPEPKKTKPVIERNARGFKIYGRVKDTHGSTVTLRVQESSAAGKECVWIFTEHPSPNYRDPEPHLSVEGAIELARILHLFVDDCIDDENWRNDPHYKAIWGS